MATSRQMILDAMTSEIQLEFTELIRQLADIPDRAARIVLFSAARQATLSDDAAHVVTMITGKERLHINHVTATLAQISEYPKDRPSHDFSKDDMYFFVTSAKFDCRVQTDAMEKLFQAECRRHYKLEPHHPEFEEIHNKECTSDDILEMAVDRMSRCIQANQGVVVMDDMKKYLPKFTLGDVAGKQEMYLSYAVTYTSLAERVYGEVSSALEVAQ